MCKILIVKCNSSVKCFKKKILNLHVILIMIFLGSTYGSFRRELEREVVALIPFTCADTYRGHLEKVRIIFQKTNASYVCLFYLDL